jgi:hypothetical protein
MAVIGELSFIIVNQGVTRGLRHEGLEVGYVFDNRSALKEDDFVEKATILDEISLQGGLLELGRRRRNILDGMAVTNLEIAI